LSITGHYIDAHADRPNDWVLRTEQFAFVVIEGRHTGRNIASILTQTVRRYGLDGKVRLTFFFYLFFFLLRLRSDGSPAMVPPSMAQPSANSKSISTPRMVRGQQKNTVYCLYLFFFFRFVSRPPLHSFSSSSLFTCPLHPTLSSFYFTCPLIFLLYVSPHLSPQLFTLSRVHLRVPSLLSPSFLLLCNVSPIFFSYIFRLYFLCFSSSLSSRIHAHLLPRLTDAWSIHCTSQRSTSWRLCLLYLPHLSERRRRRRWRWREGVSASMWANTRRLYFQRTTTLMPTTMGTVMGLGPSQTTGTKTFSSVLAIRWEKHLLSSSR
jgi:hypothetical protein